MSNHIAVIRNGKIIYGDSAIVSLPNETEARSSREGQKTKHRADLLQKNQVDYWKVHPEQAEELNPELRRLLS
jgi:hypothetical protein